MAIQVQQQGQLQELLGILRKRIWQIILPTAFVLSLGIAAAVFVPYKYTVKTQFELRPVLLNSFEGVAPDKVTSFNRSFANAQLQITHPERVRRVLEAQDWEDYETLGRLEQIEYQRRILRNIWVKVTPPPKNPDASTFLQISYTDTSPQRAEQFCNALRDTYVEEVVERYRTDARDELAKLNEIKADKRNLLDDATKRLSELQQEHGLTLTGGDRQDSKEAAYLAAQADQDRTVRELEAALARKEQLEEQYLQEPEEIRLEESDAGPDVAQALQQIDREIIQMRSEQEPYRPPHSHYQRLEAEIAQKQREREKIQALQQQTVKRFRFVPNPRRLDLQQSIDQEALKIETLRAQRERNDRLIEARRAEFQERAEVMRELAAARDAVDRHREQFSDIDRLVNRQINFVRLIDGHEGNPFELVEPGHPPSKPTSPNPVVLITVSALLGLGIGVGSALLAEYSKSCYRSVYDIARSMTVPVLGAVNTIVTRAEARRILLRKVVIVSSCLVLIGAILFVTLAWRDRPDLLGPELREIIDDIRSEFR